jgi:hypothetical protein
MKLVMLMHKERKERHDNTQSFKKTFTTLKAYTTLFGGHVQCSHLS